MKGGYHPFRNFTTLVELSAVQQSLPNTLDCKGDWINSSPLFPSFMRKESKAKEGASGAWIRRHTSGE